MGWVQTLKHWLMPRPDKFWPLDNQIQAQRFSGILAEEGIPHRIRRNGEALWGYAEQAQEGWGRLEAEEQHHAQVEQLFRDFLESEDGGLEG